MMAAIFFFFFTRLAHVSRRSFGSTLKTAVRWGANTISLGLLGILDTIRPLTVAYGVTQIGATVDHRHKQSGSVGTWLAVSGFHEQGSCLP
jgi:hypothetical protein